MGPLSGGGVAACTPAGGRQDSSAYSRLEASLVLLQIILRVSSSGQSFGQRQTRSTGMLGFRPALSLPYEVMHEYTIVSGKTAIRHGSSTWPQRGSRPARGEEYDRVVSRCLRSWDP